ADHHVVGVLALADQVDAAAVGGDADRQPHRRPAPCRPCPLTRRLPVVIIWGVPCTGGTQMSTNAIPIVYSYIRFSHPEQARGDSLRRQTEATRAWCDRNGARLDESTTLHDLGRSAFLGEHRKNPDRNALAGFLKLVEKGKIPKGSFLVIENLDRLS